MTTVYFATNRKPLEPFQPPWYGYDPAALTPDGLVPLLETSPKL